MNKEIEAMINKKIKMMMVVTILIVLVIGGMTGVIASNYLASDISYRPKDSNWKVSNVADAINSLQTSKISDNYSTEEKVVGTWIDGKPIYQKTIELVGDLELQSATWTEIGVEKGTMELIIFSYAISSAGTTVPISAALNVNGGSHVHIMHYRSNALSVKYITLQYTKTTDTVNS